MKILFLGPHSETIENALINKGHSLTRTLERISVDYLTKEKFDFCISYKYRYIIKQKEIDFFEGKLVNLHISLLPWNRGADPNLWSWVDRTPKGVTIHKIDAGCDTGDILLQEYVDFEIEKETLATTYNKLSKIIENLFIDNIDRILNQHISPKKQSNSGTYHCSADKKRFKSLLEKLGWNTPINEVISWGKSYEATSK